jgi:hypothetical protein
MDLSKGGYSESESRPRNQQRPTTKSFGELRPEHLGYGYNLLILFIKIPKIRYCRGWFFSRIYPS